MNDTCCRSATFRILVMFFFSFLFFFFSAQSSLKQFAASVCECLLSALSGFMRHSHVWKPDAFTAPRLPRNCCCCCVETQSRTSLASFQTCSILLFSVSTKSNCLNGSSVSNNWSSCFLDSFFYMRNQTTKTLVRCRPHWVICNNVFSLSYIIKWSRHAFCCRWRKWKVKSPADVWKDTNFWKETECVFELHLHDAAQPDARPQAQQRLQVTFLYMTVKEMRSRQNVFLASWDNSGDAFLAIKKSEGWKLRCRW